MAMHTGENEQALRKILDMTRLISITILIIHFYYYCYSAFEVWGWQSTFSDRILSNIYKTGLFSNFHKSKLIALGFFVTFGVLLVADAFGHHIPKGYLYFALVFSFLIELFNIRMRKIKKIEA